MAKGIGYQMAVGAMAMSSRADWYAAVLALAGFDPRVDPITGSAQGVEWNGAVFCYNSPWRWVGGTEAEGGRMVGATPRAQLVWDALVAEQARRGAKYLSDIEWDIRIVDGDGNLVATYRPGRRSGYLWSFETLVSITASPDEYPPLPEGVTALFPDWFPSLAPLNSASAQWESEINTRLETLRAEGAEIGVKFDERRYPEKHPEWYCLCWEQAIQNRKESMLAEQRAAERAVRETSEMVSRLDREGWIHERAGHATIPSWAHVIRVDSMGSKRDPQLLIVGRKLTHEQLESLVRGWGGTVERRGNTAVITSDNAGMWIGRGGETIRSISRAYGKRVEVAR